MIRYYVNLIKCIIFGHNYIDGGSCPFTGKSYNTCIKCERSVEK